MATSLELFRDSIPLFSMLQDENRQRILVLLCHNPEMTVTAITENMGLSRPAVSHHLSLLLAAKLVSVSKRGTQRRYSIHLDDAISLMRALLTSLEQDSASAQNQH